MSDGSSKHERRMQRREERKTERQYEAHKEGKKNRGLMLLVVGAIVLLGAGYLTFSAPPSSSGVPVTSAVTVAQSDLVGIPNTFVHWHADVDVILCGEKQQLPEASPGSLIGNRNMHTHARSANLGSLPNSDGNGVIHNEGLILNQPSQQTVGAFMDHMNIVFATDQIMHLRNGDACSDGSSGTVQFFVNGEPNPQFRNYIPRDGDFIKIEFS